MHSVGRRRNRGPLVAGLALACLVGSSCGSNLSDQQLQQASLEAFRAAASPGAPTAGASADPAATTASDAAAVSRSGLSSSSGAAGSPTAGSMSPTGSAPSATGVAGGGTAGPGRGTTAAGGSSTGMPSRPSTPAGAAGSSAGPTASPAASTGPKAEIRLGMFGTQSGPVGQVLLPIVDAAKAWAADVNARGGLGGHPVRLINADDAGDPNRALSVARRFVEQDKVQALYAVHAPTTLQAVTPYLEQVKIPIVGSCECADIGAESPMVFHPGAAAKTGLAWAHIAPLISLSDKRKAAVFYCRDVPACATLNDQIRRLAPLAGVDIVHTAQVSIAQPDFTAEVIQARNAGAEAIIGVVDNATVVRIARSAHRQNYRPVLSMQENGYDPRFLRDGGDDIEGALTSTGGIVPWSTSPKLADYRAAMDRYVPGGTKSTLASEFWGAGKMLELIAPGLPDNPASQDIVNGLYELRNETVGGLFPPLTFARDAAHGNANQCVIPVKVENHEFVPASEDRWVCAPGWKPVGQ